MYTWKFNAKTKQRLGTTERLPEVLQSEDHLLIEADNIEVLNQMQVSMQDSVDFIYIDPPYNTGLSRFGYNDKMEADTWLEFMRTRLLKAKDLLSSRGVIFISIDEYEIFNLGRLTDEIFGVSNRVANFIWFKNAPKNCSKTVSNVHEYILCYAKDIEVVKSIEDMFRIKKVGYSEVMEFYNNLRRMNYSHERIGTELRQYYKTHDVGGGVSGYTYSDNTGIYTKAPVASPNVGGTYDVLHPTTGLPCKRPSSGWSLCEKTMNERIEAGLIVFGSDHTSGLSSKLYLKDTATQVMPTIINDAKHGAAEIVEMFGTKIFKTAKPSSLIKTLILATTKQDSIVMDFFAGSGTTGAAVLDANAEDGGSRRMILVTNNEIVKEDRTDREVSISRQLCAKRLENLIGGYTTSKGKIVEGFGGCYTFTSLLELVDYDIDDIDVTEMEF